MTFTQTYVAGQKLRASQLRALVTQINAIDFTNTQPVVGIVTADQSVINSTTLVSATNITVPGIGGQTIYVELDLAYEGTAAGDFKMAWTWPAPGVFPWSFHAPDTGLAFSAIAFNSAVTSGTSIAIGGNGAGATLYAKIRGVWQPNTSGSLQFQFAQNVAAAATSATIKVGTSTRYTRF